MSLFPGWAVDVLSPEELSAKMLQRSRHSLNEISHDSAIGLVRRAISEVSFELFLFDAPRTLCILPDLVTCRDTI